MIPIPACLQHRSTPKFVYSNTGYVIRVARGHSRAPGEKATHLAPIHPSLLLGIGGICATATDLARWNQALHGGRVIAAASYAAMTTPRGAPAIAANYGLGLSIRREPWGARIMLHEGTTRGYAAANAWFPAESLSVVVLYNGVPRPARDADAIISQLALGLTPKPAPPPRPQPAPLAAATRPIAPADAGRFAGEYEMFPGANITVTLDDGVLWAKPPAAMGGSGQALAHKSGTTFGLGKVDAQTTFTFIVDAAGVVTGVRLPVGGTERTLKKVK